MTPVGTQTEPAPQPVTPLAGQRVAQHGRSLPVAFAGKLLADFGASVCCPAEVTGLATPWGADGASSAARAAYERYFNERKCLCDEAEFRGAVAESDILLLDRESIDSGGFVLHDLLDTHPAMVVTTISPYGLSGPRSAWRATDFTLQARGGLSFGVGESDGPPLPLPGQQAEMQGGLAGAIGSLLAVLARDTTGLGQHVDISIDEVISTFFTGYYLPRYIYGGGVPGRRSGRVGSNSPYPNTVMRCSDGLVALIAPQLDQWIRFVKLMGEPDWSKEPRYRDRRAMQWEYKAEVDRLVEPWFAERSKSELITDFIASRIPFAPLLDGHDLLQIEHLSSRRALRSIRLADGTEVTIPAAPYLLNGQRLEAGLDLSQGPPGRGRAPRPRRGALQPSAAEALRGIRVLDLGTAWAGGMAGRILADFGADVIKVESLRHLDGSRRGKPIGVEDVAGGDEGRWPELQPGFHVIGRNKLSIGIDLRAPGAPELIADLAGHCDAVIHNFSSGVMERLGLTDEFLRSRNRRLVIVGQSVAGYSGPMSGYVGYNSTVGGLSGFFQRVGYEGEEPIGTAEGLFSDIVSALTTVLGVLASLIGDQAATLEVSQWEATLALIPETLVAAATGHQASQCGRRNWGVAPNGVYPGAGEDEWLAISVPDGESWAALARLIGCTDLADDPELATVAGRSRRAPEIDDLVRTWSLRHGAVAAVEMAQQAGIAASVAGHIGDLFADEHLRSRQAWIDTEHPLIGFEPLPGVGLSLSGTPGAVQRPAPFVGQHSDLVLGQLLGYDPAKIDQLVSRGVVERSVEPATP